MSQLIMSHSLTDRGSSYIPTFHARHKLHFLPGKLLALAYKDVWLISYIMIAKGHIMAFLFYTDIFIKHVARK